MDKPINIDAYIAGFPAEIQELLHQIRRTVQKAAPDAEETISYGMPTFVLHGNLVHFAAYKNHIGFYPAPGAVETFKDALAAYKGAKGSVQFPINKPMPLDLIAAIVKYRITENLKKIETHPKRNK